MTSRARIPCAVLLAACGWLWPADAHAKGIVLITHGAHITPIGEVTPALPAKQEPEEAIRTAPPAPAPAPDPAAEEARQQERIAAAFEDAVTHLTAQGIPRAEAEEKLSQLLSALQTTAEPSPSEAIQAE